jgi:large subunit ribosomal protein L27
MSTTKASGTTKLGRDSKPKYLGVKLYAGQKVKPGMIIIKQRGTKFIPGKNVKRGSDDTLYATKAGTVKFTTSSKKSFNNSRKKSKVVNVE